MYRTGRGTAGTGAVGVLVFALVFALLVVGVAGCRRNDKTTPAKPSGSETSTEGGSAEEPVDGAGGAMPLTSEVRAYFMNGEKVTPVSGKATGKGVAAAAMELLLAGPNSKQAEQGLSSSIPVGTKLRGVAIEDGVATVDLSPEFASGGGTLSMTSRVAQVVFTLTQFPTVTQVLFEIEGEPLDVLGGEGIILEHSRTRPDQELFAPQVLVESPTWGEAVPLASALRVTGTANTFEAEFQLEIANATGKILRTERVMATSGSGTRGTFDATISLSGLAPGDAFLVASYLSAKDGSRVVVVEVPIVVE